MNKGWGLCDRFPNFFVSAGIALRKHVPDAVEFPMVSRHIGTEYLLDDRMLCFCSFVLR